MLRGCKSGVRESYPASQYAPSGSSDSSLGVPADYREVRICLAILSPLILTADLLLLLWGEVVGDVEGLADLLRRLSLNHVGNGLTANIKERFDVQVVGRL